MERPGKEPVPAPVAAKVALAAEMAEVHELVVDMVPVLVDDRVNEIVLEVGDPRVAAVRASGVLGEVATDRGRMSADSPDLRPADDEDDEVFDLVVVEGRRENAGVEG